MTVTGRDPRRDDERGSIALEFVFLAMVVVLLLALIGAYGRVAEVNGTLEAGTRDAARMATTARSYPEAQSLARRAVGDQVTVTACRDSLDVTVSQPFAPGENVRVSATCHYSLSDLGMLFGFTMTPTSSFSSPLDPNRGLDQ